MRLYQCKPFDEPGVAWFLDKPVIIGWVMKECETDEYSFNFQLGGQYGIFKYRTKVSRSDLRSDIINYICKEVFSSKYCKTIEMKYRFDFSPGGAERIADQMLEVLNEVKTKYEKYKEEMNEYDQPD